MEQILLAYGVHKETVTDIKMLHQNKKLLVRSTNGDKDFFKQEDT